MDASVGISIASLVVAIIFGLANRRHADRAVRHEQADRREQLDLLRTQIAGDEDDRRRQGMARLWAEYGPGSGGDTHDERQLWVENAGPGLAHDLAAVVVTASGSEYELGDWPPLRPGKRWPILARVPRAQARQGDMTLRVSWRDDSGPHKAELLSFPPVTRQT
jgi:hypothetical protein